MARTPGFQPDNRGSIPLGAIFRQAQDKFLRMWCSGNTFASQAKDRRFESGHPLHFHRRRLR